MKTRFYDVHVFYGRQNGYSVGVKIESVNRLNEEQIIEFTTDNDLFTDDGDQNYVDYVEEIDEQTYYFLKA
jgi:uncharacterized beta-barrel protein YwiB (DUF1934 family)